MLDFQMSIAGSESWSSAWYCAGKVENAKWCSFTYYRCWYFGFLQRGFALRPLDAKEAFYGGWFCHYFDADQLLIRKRNFFDTSSSRNGHRRGLVYQSEGRHGHQVDGPCRLYEANQGQVSDREYYVLAGILGRKASTIISTRRASSSAKCQIGPDLCHNLLLKAPSRISRLI